MSPMWGSLRMQNLKRRKETGHRDDHLSKISSDQGLI